MIVAVMAAAAMLATTSRADAHPFDAPQLSDVAGRAHTPASCDVGFTSVTGRNISGRTAVFTLERKFDGEWKLASFGNDGGLAYIDGVRYEGRAEVTIDDGQLFEIDHYQWPGDSGEYRLIARWPDNQAIGPLAGWFSEHPSNCGISV